MRNSDLLDDGLIVSPPSVTPAAEAMPEIAQKFATSAVAGFWQRNRDGVGFTMVTCNPNELVAPIHPKVMLTILHPHDVDTWLRGSNDEVVALQRPYDAAAMTVRGPVFPTRARELDIPTAPRPSLLTAGCACERRLTRFAFRNPTGEYPETATAAEALLDWVALVRAAVAAVSPNETFSIEIVGVTPGSSRFPQLLKWGDDQFALIKSAWDEYPSLKKVIVGSAHTLVTGTVTALIAQAVAPHEQLVRLSDVDRRMLSGLQRDVASDPATQAASKRFYRTILRDKAITGVGVADDWQKRPEIIVPRQEFAERSGLWDAQQDADEEETRVAEWDVVLLRPT